MVEQKSLVDKLPASPAELPTTKANILVVDDRPEGLLALEAVLSSQHYNLIKASSGREALYHALDHDFAVILLDVQMPEMDGFETAKLIRENYRSQTTPIIFVTAIHKESRHINQGYESGAVDYIFKPLDPLVLKSKVNIFVDLFNKNQQIQRQTLLLNQMELREKERQMAELRQESLTRYANLADAIPHSIIKIQRDGKIEYLNQQWYKYTGTQNKSKIDWEQIIHPEDRRKFLMFWLEGRRKKLRTSQIEMRLRRAEDGSYRWHLVRLVPELKDAEIIGWIATCTDIDNIKKTEERFRLLSEELDRSNKELEHFAFVASHDLQEPLRIVNSYIDLLALRYKDKLDSHAQEIIQVTKDGITRAQKLIRDLLEYARVGIKQKIWTKAGFEDIVKQSMFNISLLIKEREAHITYDPLPTLVVDEAQMVQLFQNLLSNSLKYCNQIPKIHIKARKTHGEWIFSFQDNGIGIDSQYYERIFVIFQRLHLMNQYEGTGIGLAICKKIIQRHGGKIWLESEMNKGTTFYFSLPENHPNEETLEKQIFP